MPKLWNETIEEHRRAVHDAALDTTAALVAELGLASVTMSRIAAETGIGRATLYKYFPDVEEAVLAAYALITYQRPQGTEIASLVHRGERMAQAEQELLGFVSDLIAAAAQAGELRDDAGPAELARYCLHALGAAGRLPSEAAVSRLVAVTMTGLRPPR